MSLTQLEGKETVNQYFLEKTLQESGYKPGSVIVIQKTTRDRHSSRDAVTHILKQPTRKA